MTRLYKLTDRQESTYNDTVWGENVTHSIPADRPGFKLCSSQVIHAYEHPVIAVLLNPVHAGFYHPLLWEAEGEVVVRDGQLKCGVKKLTTLRRIPLPTITHEQQQRIGLRCALKVYSEPRFVALANAWLDGIDYCDRQLIANVFLTIPYLPKETFAARTALKCLTTVEKIDLAIAKIIDLVGECTHSAIDLVRIIEAGGA